MIQGLDHVQLSAPSGCEEAARTFFGGMLGLIEIEKPAELRGRGGVWFVCGGQQIHIGIENPHSPAEKAHPAFRVSSVESLRDLASNLEKADYAVTWDDGIPGLRRFYTQDPWGNRLELLA